MATAFHLALLAPVALALTSSALTYWQGWRYFSEDGFSGDSFSGERARSEPVGEPVEEGASVIVPLRGLPEGIDQLLETLLSEEGAKEVIVAVEEPGDPAATYVQDTAEDRDGLRLAVAEETRPGGGRSREEGQAQREATGKIANLAAGASKAGGDLLVFVDADVRLRPGMIRDLLRPLSAQKVGLVFGAQVGAKSPGAPSVFSHMFMNDSAMLYGAAARRGQLPGAAGALMATRREVLEAVGGLSQFSDKIAGDIPLGQAVREAGFDLRLLRRPVPVGGEPETWGAVMRRQHRWMVTIQAFLPSFAAYVAAASLPVTWSLLFCAVAAWRGALLGVGLGALGLSLLWRGASAAVVGAGLAGDRGLLARPDVLLIGELIWVGVFLWSLASKRVWWAGRQFEVGPGGTKRLIETSAP